jgi:serine/threonine-protein kinase
MLGQVVLGRYKVTRLLDEGGMSKVYLARQIDQPRDVVVKVLKEALAAQSRSREHFRREIHIMSRFSHPHAVAYYDSSTREAGGPVLVMEYLRGVDLNTLLQREGRLTPERTGRLLVQLCDVLQAAHDAGIVHRDIKPGNLMIVHPGTPHEIVKLMDFGLAKMSAMFYISPDDLVSFELPPASGTPEYIAPEMVRGTDMDERGDLYSVGVVLFELLSGRRPFVDGSIEELMIAHRDDLPPRFADIGLPDLVSPALEAVVRSCLHKHPEGRPRNAWDLALAYERALGRRLTTGRAVVKSGQEKRDTKTPVPATRGSGVVRTVGSGQVRTVGSGVVRNLQAAPPTQTADAEERGVVRKSFESQMPEVMALLKLKGFISDLGGEVVESVPGMIRVRVADPGEQKAQAGLLGWMGGRRTPTPAAAAAELELHMERNDPDQPNRMTITLVLRPGGLPVNAEWTNRCNRISRELQAYLMG